MAQSGVKLGEDVKEVFNLMKKKKSNYKYITLRLTDDLKSIEIHTTQDKSAAEGDGHWETFRAEMKAAEEKGECRYAIYDYDYMTADNASNQKLCFVFWAPDNAKIKQKMVYASSKGTVTTALVSGFTEFQANDYDQLDAEEWSEKLKKKM